MSASNVSVAKVQTSDKDVNQLQQNITVAVNQLQQQINNSPSKGIFLSSTLSAGDNTINHTLGRTPVGYLVTSSNSPAIIYQKSLAANQVVLNASQSATVSLFLF